MSTNGRRFNIDVTNVVSSELLVNEEISKVQRYLHRFGYLNAGFDTGRLDSSTQNALRAYQRRAGIDITGNIDKPTADLLEEPRCGLPDGQMTEGPLPEMQPFSSTCRYDGAHLGASAGVFELEYSIVTPPPNVSLTDVKSHIRFAFDQWEEQIPIDFREVSLSDNPTFTFTWVAGNHGDGKPFDGRDGNVLAHAFLPPACGGTHAGQCHFDIEERWDFSHSSGIRDIWTVVLHEIGHLLGLEHSQTGVMFERYRGQRRELSQDDINAIQARYGQRP